MHTLYCSAIVAAFSLACLGCSGADDVGSEQAAAPARDLTAWMTGSEAAAERSRQPVSGEHAAARPAAGGRYESVRIEKMPHVRQKPDFCGEACAEMALRRLGLDIDQDDVFNRSGLSPLEGRGCYTRELAAALQNIGFRAGPVWHRVAAAEADRELEALWSAVHADLLRGVPSILCMRTGEQPGASEHFRLLVGYDADADEVLYHEPAEADGAYRRMPRPTLLRVWPLKYEREVWTVIRLRLEPGELRRVATTAGFTPADYAQHILRLKRRMPATDRFHLVIQPPFVVIGNEPPETVERRAENTVKWAVDRLKAEYFANDPHEILDIWLFKDKPTYEHYAEEMFGEKPGTPFGYYSPRHKALVMNIATGGGTLVHEIVHPFVEANFPRCPSWFNEGLGSLYEQCGDRDGRIAGYTNWRLAGLQQAIRANAVPSFKTLCNTRRNEFYNADPGTNYAQARYLCYYLQEKGLLAKFYHQFVASQEDDPSGYATLQAVLGESDMAAFERQWRQFVLQLRFE